MFVSLLRFKITSITTTTNNNNNTNTNTSTICIGLKFSDCRKEGRKKMFYLTTNSTHFIYGYIASDSERGNPLPPHGLLFPISNKSSFICIIP